MAGSPTGRRRSGGPASLGLGRGVEGHPGAGDGAGDGVERVSSGELRGGASGLYAVGGGRSRDVGGLVRLDWSRGQTRPSIRFACAHGWTVLDAATVEWAVAARWQQSVALAATRRRRDQQHATAAGSASSG